MPLAFWKIAAWIVALTCIAIPLLTLADALAETGPTYVSPWPGECSERQGFSHCLRYDVISYLVFPFAAGIVGAIAAITWSARARRAATVSLALMWLPFFVLNLVFVVDRPNGLARALTNGATFAGVSLVAAAVFWAGLKLERPRAAVAQA